MDRRVFCALGHRIDASRRAGPTSGQKTGILYVSSGRLLRRALELARSAELGIQVSIGAAAHRGTWGQP